MCRICNCLGVPILGEAGVGYTLRRDFDLPPLMFDRREITALVLGSRMVAAWGDAELASAANDALRKIEAVLTPALRDRIDAVPLYVPGYGLENQGATRQTLERLRGAIESNQKIEIAYRDEKAAGYRTPPETDGTSLLGECLDACRVVRAAGGLSQLSRRPISDFTNSR
jgi:predicted DNA-binding transcriptional regulator YafY